MERKDEVVGTKKVVFERRNIRLTFKRRRSPGLKVMPRLARPYEQ